MQEFGHHTQPTGRQKLVMDRRSTRLVPVRLRQPGLTPIVPHRPPSSPIIPQAAVRAQAHTPPRRLERPTQIPGSRAQDVIEVGVVVARRRLLRLVVLCEARLQLGQEDDRLVNAQLLRRVQEELGLRRLQPVHRVVARVEEPVIVELQVVEVARQHAAALLAGDGRHVARTGLLNRLVDVHIFAEQLLDDGERLQLRVALGDLIELALVRLEDALRVGVEIVAEAARPLRSLLFRGWPLAHVLSFRLLHLVALARDDRQVEAVALVEALELATLATDGVDGLVSLAASRNDRHELARYQLEPSLLATLLPNFRRQPLVERPL